jgi:hypothetical protein
MPGRKRDPPDDPPERLREKASHARNLARTITDPEIIRRLKDWAEELEAEAARLEGEADKRSDE